MKRPWRWCREKAGYITRAIGAREVVVVIGAYMLWRGISAFDPGLADAVVGGLLVYVGLWHAAVIAALNRGDGR